MDWLDWTVRCAGGLFGLLTLVFGLSRISTFTERDVPPYWMPIFALVGIVWAISLVADWLMPIETTLYLANGGDTAREARIDSEVTCIPGKSYDGYTYRWQVPSLVIVAGSSSDTEQRYPVGRGTWFINTSPVVVTADMYEPSASTIDFNALMSPSAGALHISSHYGRPYRMFSQSPLDRFYSPSGDVAQRSFSGPCPNTTPEASPR